jgi:hypothetical protein
VPHTKFLTDPQVRLGTVKGNVCCPAWCFTHRFRLMVDAPVHAVEAERGRAVIPGRSRGHGRLRSCRGRVAVGLPRGASRTSPCVSPWLWLLCRVSTWAPDVLVPVLLCRQRRARNQVGTRVRLPGGPCCCNRDSAEGLIDSVGLKGFRDAWRGKRIARLEKDPEFMQWLDSSGLKGKRGDALKRELERRAGGVRENSSARRRWGRNRGGTRG